MTTSNTYPHIIVLDLDGTIIGNNEPQLCFIQIFQYISRHCFDNELEHMNMKAIISQAMRDGLARPYLKEFFETISNLHGNYELFVYTASSKDIGNIMVECVEDAFDIQFNRPIFTSKDCTHSSYYIIKSIKQIHTKLINCIYKKYPQCKNMTYDDLLQNITIIDNNMSCYLPTERCRIIHCSTYNQITNIDILKYFPKGLIAKHYKHIISILENYMNMKFYGMSRNMYICFNKQYIQNILQYNMINHTSTIDNLWETISSIFRDLESTAYF